MATPTGLLKLRIKSAKLDRDVEWFAKMDPYVVIKIGGRDFKSHVCKRGGKAPLWDEVRYIIQESRTLFHSLLIGLHD